MYISITDAKKHLNIDDDFTEDDEYIVSLIAASEDAVAKRLNLKDLSVMLTDQGYLSESVKHAILFLIGNWYANREPVAYGNAVKVPYALEFLFDINKNYNSVF